MTNINVTTTASTNNKNRNSRNLGADSELCSEDLVCMSKITNVSRKRKRGEHTTGNESHTQSDNLADVAGTTFKMCSQCIVS
jgi:hypothetical protein